LRKLEELSQVRELQEHRSNLEDRLERERTQALARIQAERLILLDAKKELDAKLFLLQNALAEAQAHYARLDAEAAAVLNAGRAIENRVAQLNLWSHFPISDLERLQIQTEIEELRSEYRAYDVTYRSINAQGAKASVLASSFETQIADGMAAMQYLHIRANRLYKQYLELDP
jgi:hypothetical protein